MAEARDAYGTTRGAGLNRSYVTGDSDTLESVAAFFYGTEERADALRDRNPEVAGLAAMSYLAPGMRLRVPDEDGVALSDQYGVTSGEGGERTYTTKPGDTLESVAGYFYGAAEHRAAIESANSAVAGYDANAPLPPGLQLAVAAES